MIQPTLGPSPRPSQSPTKPRQSSPNFRTIGESNGVPQINQGVYDLPALIDLALRINPQTRSAWYAAQAAQAQLGQAHAADYPKVDVEGVGGYLKLPIRVSRSNTGHPQRGFPPSIQGQLRPARLRQDPRRGNAVRANSSSPPTSRSTAQSRTWFSTWKRPTTSCPRRKRASALPRPISSWRGPVSAPSRSAIRWVLRRNRKS